VARLRPASAADAPFLQRVYASTRADELALTNWSDEQKARFCASQFAAQDSHYRQHYSTAQFSVLERGGVPAGRLIVDRWAKEIRIVDITLLPEHRGAGLGTRLLHDLQREAAAAGKALSIHVEKFNPALRLYERLGFQVKEDKGVYVLMEWSSAEAAPQESARRLS
jgi:ribosomal protein S18 acetylase RimI-like enzyme